MQHPSPHNFINRLGFHYFPDSEHYSQKDADIWLNELSNLGTAWLVMQTPLQRAIPEDFIMQVLEGGMQPVLHFKLKCDSSTDQDNMRMLLKSYARWGVNYVMMFDRPNSYSSWSPATWFQTDLVDRFLDSFLPIAQIILEEKMIPVFPPLEPGGDFWDLAFLRLALQSIIRRGQTQILDALVLGAYGDILTRPLEWGIGGMERWQESRPYSDNLEQQDQQGFHIFDWYFGVCRHEIGELLPLILMGLGGYRAARQRSDNRTVDEEAYRDRLCRLLENLTIDGIDPTTDKPFPNELLGCIFDGMISTLLIEGEISVQDKNNGNLFSNLDAIRLKRVLRWGQVKTTNPSMSLFTEPLPEEQITLEKEERQKPLHLKRPRISHYVLLPLYAWGAADWDIEMIQPLIQQSHPTVGYSLEEALQAEQVTIVGGPGAISEDAMELLLNAGCLVQRMMPDGTVVAT